MKSSFFIENRKCLFKQMKDNSIVVLFSGKAPKKSADELYPFTPNRNFYYITGVAEEDVMVVLGKSGEKQEVSLFIKKANPVLEKWVGKTISQEEAKEVSGIETIQHIEDFTATVHKYLENPAIEIAYFDLERNSFEESASLEQVLAKKCITKYPYITIKNIYPILSELRVIKSKEEIEKMKMAIDITEEGIMSLMENARPNMYEYELEACFDFVLKCKGVKDYAFKTIAASGANGTVLHYSSNDSKIEKDSLILFDLGAQYDYYNADISRTFPVSGKFTDRQKLFYNIVLRAHTEVIQMIKPGIHFSELNKHVRAIYLEELSKLELATTDEEVSQYYYHGVSHFLGLDTHDVGSRDTVLKEGMVLTVEPGLYIEQEAIGIRIEDDVVVTETGCEVLSPHIIRTVEEIEAFMNR